MSAALNACLKQAIVAARGDKADAARRLVSLAKHDSAVLLALVEPYLQGIAFDAVGKVMARATALARPRPPAAPASILAAAVEGAAPKQSPTRPMGGAILAATVEGASPKPVPSPPAPQRAVVKKPNEILTETLDAIFDRIGKSLPPVQHAVRPPKTPEEAVMRGIGRDPNGPPPTIAGIQHQKAILAMAQSFKRR